MNQRLPVACPRCRRTLLIRFEAIGKKGGCKYCGHRFRAVSGTDHGPSPGRDRAATAPTGDLAADFGRLVGTMERELQQSLALLTARQTSVVEHLIAAVGDQVVQSQDLAREQLAQSLSALLDPQPDRSDFDHAPPFVTRDSSAPHDPVIDIDPASEEFPTDPFATGSGDWPFVIAPSFVSPSIHQAVAPEAMGRGSDDFLAGYEASRVPGEGPFDGPGRSMPSSDGAERYDRLVRERDEALAECGRLREEALALRSKMAGQTAEFERLRKAAEAVDELRSECDRLGAERDMMRRETQQIQARLVELQITLVETEAELDDGRERVRAERLEWEERCRGIVAECERRLAEQRGDFEVERQAWAEQVEDHRKAEHEAEAVRAKVKKLRGLYDATRLERDEARQQVETLARRCAALSAYLDEAQAERLAADQAHQAEIDRLNSALAEALDEAESALRSDVLHAEQVRKLQADLAQHERELSLFLQPQSPGGDPD